ncbi:MAG: hypothetical protein AVDCRST_MAG88-3018 [uncultured Thermomicrobiales bacterium]|uniref:Uncharacterized protein n=1 Tax=uncultured Thermomicrobiales bacterium TaxID=1645740 RepID=A0A6J4VGV0_9BACT|nr:MAG: hypothetical protein AVDCRST_MAG88-3018 [uncultured Thermomicrobiales bacterium]
MPTSSKRPVFAPTSLVATDFDGTLLRADGTIADRPRPSYVGPTPEGVPAEHHPTGDTGVIARRIVGR